MLAAGQLSVRRSSASALLENDLIRVPEDWMVMLDTGYLGWICGVHLSTSGVSNIFTGLCAGRFKRFAFLENGFTLWPTEPVIRLNSSLLLGGEWFFFISALTKLLSGANGGWHFNSGESWVKKKKCKSKFYLGHFQTGKANYEPGPPHIFPMYSAVVRDYSLLLRVEYWWRILPEISFCVLVMRSASSSLNMMKWVLSQVRTAIRYLDNSSVYLFLVTPHTTQLQQNKSWAVEIAKLCYTSFLLHTLGCFSGGLWIWFIILHGLKFSCCYWKVLNFETSTVVR